MEDERAGLQLQILKLLKSLVVKLARCEEIISRYTKCSLSSGEIWKSEDDSSVHLRTAVRLINCVCA